MASQATRLSGRPTEPPALYDAWVDGPRRPLVAAQRAASAIHRYQRLVTNPFLAALGVVLVLLAVKEAYGMQRFDLICLSLGCTYFVRHLLHFHCLDCGGTGRLHFWREHHCQAVAERLIAGRPRWLRGPRPGTQLFLWLTGALVVALVTISGGMR